jgi:anion-transporting  ArsA/GET3 family ATPase
MSPSHDDRPGVGSPTLNIDDVLADPTIRTILCCGSGGVGKTTTSAALGLRAAEQGRTVAVLTIDPARRLAQSLGLDMLDNTPRAVAGVDTSGGGELDAMMLDMKRTFDDLVLSHTDAERAEQIFANPFYQSLSSSFAGTQEYMAMEKLSQLRETSRWDLVVVDTPPSRSALDFLDAPKRLGSFLDGRFIRLLTAPTRAGGRAYVRMMSAGMSMLTATISKFLGAGLLSDVQSFLAAFETMFGGFRERAERTYAELQDGQTAFLVVATPERDALREASFFVQRLETDKMPLAGLVLNRLHTHRGASLGPDRALELAAELWPDQARRRAQDVSTREATANLLRLHAINREQSMHEGRQVGRFTAEHPAVPIAVAPALAGDVHDLEALRTVGASLAGTAVPSGTELSRP